MSTIKPLADADFPAYVDILARAYPAMGLTTPEKKEQRLSAMLDRHHNEPVITAYGAYRDGVLRGGMMCHDFTMQLFEERVLCGGVGTVAVDLLHKKEGIARDLLIDFIRHYDEQGAPLVALHPFRPDFYKQMGFGYGTKKARYRISPAALPRGTSRAHLRYLGPDDEALVREFHDRTMSQTHGMFALRNTDVRDRLLTNDELTVIGYIDDAGDLHGYMVMASQPMANGHPLINDLVVRAVLYLQRDALAEMLTYLHTQADQFDRIIFETHDEYLHHLLADPRNGNEGGLIPHAYHEAHTTGVGLMSRVINVSRFFESLPDHNFAGQTVTLQISVTDSFYPANDGKTVVQFTAGRAVVLPGNAPAEIAIALDVSEFSSLVLGCVPFERLFMYGLAAIADEAQVNTVDRLFHTAEKPVCLTVF
ncbi:enhanced intracellular survival protein Eis [Chloroflexota bacterium]